MCRFIETLCIRQGKVQHLPYHQERVNRSRQQLLGLSDPLTLEEAISVPDSLWQSERVKCRILYASSVEEITFSEYQPRSIQALRLLADDTIEYSYKFTDRDRINQLFAQRGKADDILIVKQGFITDTSYSNVAFYDGSQWITPHQPLLAGTCRARLLNEGHLIEKPIAPEDLSDFSHCCLINAMLPLGECQVAVADIRWDI